jgi:hypothetical protein
MSGVQRLYSMFPTGPQGVALLLLRVSLSGFLLATVLTPLAKLDSAWIPAVPWALAMALWAGLFTPVVAALCGLVVLSLWITGLSAPTWLCACTILDAAALSLLGPGAYSLDARLYGRRRIIPAPRDRSSRR